MRAEKGEGGSIEGGFLNTRHLGLPCLVRMSGSTPDLCPLSASTKPPLCQPEMAPHIAKCPMFENHRDREGGRLSGRLSRRVLVPFLKDGQQLSMEKAKQQHKGKCRGGVPR